MPEALLQTKFYIPSLRPNRVIRQRLIDRLNQGLDENLRLTLISAPAGFGKTTLIIDWIQSLTKKGKTTGDQEPPSRTFNLIPSNVAWLSLDKNDNDPYRFLTYLNAALNKMNSAIGRDFETQASSSQAIVITPYIGVIINDIAAADLKIPLVLFLEDYHFIHSMAIHEGLNYLLDHLPPEMHLVITSRADPPLMLSRWRARNQMVELRARDLRFTYSEAASFLNNTMGLNLGADAIATFEQRTEGWIAGLQLAALSLQQQDDPLRFVTSFAGDDHYVADYLLEEVFQQQPAPLQSFLLNTSILDTLSAPLCDAVMEVNNSQQILTELEGSNLFIVALDSQRRYYRYHHLFADLLRHRLGETVDLGEIASLHGRASRWFEKEGSLIQAIEHALAAGEYLRVVGLIENNEEELFIGSQLNSLLDWWSEIPLDLIESRPKMCLIYSWAWLATSHPEEAESCLLALEQSLGAVMDEMVTRDSEDLDPAVRGALIEAAVIRGQIAIHRDEFHKGLVLSQMALSALAEEDQPFLFNPPVNSRMIAFFNMGLVYKIRGELAAAESALSKAAELGTEEGNLHITAVAFGQLASVQAIRGHLNQANETCQRGLRIVQQMTGSTSPMSGRLLVEQGALLYERNNLEEARHYFTEGITVARPWGYMDALLPGYMGLANLLVNNGDLDDAFYVLDELSELASGNPEVKAALDMFRARMWTAQGKVDAAATWLKTTGLSPEAELSYLREEENIVQVRVLMALNNLQAADNLIRRLLAVTESGERWRRVIELLILQALLFQRADRNDESLRTLGRALALAEPHGYVRIFTDEGPQMAKLLYQAAVQGIRQGYAGELLSSFNSLESAPSAEAAPLVTTEGIIEPLSPREIEVLGCLTEGLSNREIAQRLTISLATVKTHTRNIYRKLDVRNRTQAVAKGRVLGIDPHH